MTFMLSYVRSPITRVLWHRFWLLVGVTTPLWVVSFGFETSSRTADQIQHWTLVPGVAAALLVLVGFILAGSMITACHAWAIGAYAGSALAVVASIFSDDRWYILGAVLAVPVYMFTYGVIDGRFRARSVRVM
jgi:hypothetical protein